MQFRWVIFRLLLSVAQPGGTRSPGLLALRGEGSSTTPPIWDHVSPRLALFTCRMQPHGEWMSQAALPQGGGFSFEQKPKDLQSSCLLKTRACQLEWKGPGACLHLARASQMSLEALRMVRVVSDFRGKHAEARPTV